MKQEFKIGTEVSVIVPDEEDYPVTEYGKIIGYNEKGYFKSPFFGFKRYKIQLVSGEIIFSGASKIKEIK